MARRLLPLLAAFVSTAPAACRADRIPVSIICFPLRVNGENCWANSGTRGHHGRRALIGGAIRGQASASRASAKPVPHASLGLRIRGARIRRAEEKELPAAADHRAAAERFVTPGRRPDRRGFCAAPSWRVPGGLRSREQKPGALPEPYGRQIRGLALPCSSRW